MVTAEQDRPLWSEPTELAPNTVPSFYSGAGRIGQWRGTPGVPATDPEDWIASTARRTGMGDRGLTVLPDGTRLQDAIARHPEQWLGPDHVARRGPSTALLLKLLDAGQRLPVHIHPSGAFAREHLGHRDGKVEAWLVLHAEPGASVHLGFSEDVSAQALQEWVDNQDTGALLSAMNRIAVKPGDVFLCPAGVPHAIGEGILVIELQEPTDLSIMLEWEGFPIAAADRFLGLDGPTALSAVDRTGYAGARFDELRGRTIVAREAAPAREAELLPPGADPYFGAEQVFADGQGVGLRRGFAVLFVMDGEGTLSGEGFSPRRVRPGQTWLLPWSAGDLVLDGTVSAIRCYPR